MKKFFTLIAATFIAMAVNAQVYKFASVPENGATINGIPEVTLTLGTDASTWKDLNKGAVTVNGEEYPMCVACANTNPNPNKGKVPTEGAYLKFTANEDCKLVAVIYVNGGKEFQVIKDTKSGQKEALIAIDEASTFAEGANGGYQADDAYAGPVTFAVEKGNDYYVYCQGSKLGIYGYTTAKSEPTPDPTPGEPTGAKETYVAVSNVDGAWVAADVFANAVIANGESTVKFGTDNMDVVAVSGTTAKDAYQEAGTDFAGWTEWNDVKWDVKNQGDIAFGYILGTGNPAVSFTAEEVLDEGSRTGHYRPAYEFYEADGSKGMPVMGLYYKFSPKANGKLSVSVWSNKGNRNTFFVDEATKQPVAYTVEGYINSQDEVVGQDENGNDIKKKKWLTNDEILALHAEQQAKEEANGKTFSPYIIGAGNQPFWGNIIINVEAGKTYWLFQHSSQIGFQSYEFTIADGIQDVIATPAAKVMKTIKNGKIVIINGNNTYNVAGQLVK